MESASSIAHNPSIRSVRRTSRRHKEGKAEAMSSATIPRTPADLTAEWLTTALRGTKTIENSTVTSITVDADIAAGAGFMGQLARVTLRYDEDEAGAPSSLIAKF